MDCFRLPTDMNWIVAQTTLIPRPKGTPEPVIDTEQITQTIGSTAHPCPTNGPVCEWVLSTTHVPWLATLIGQVLPLILWAIFLLILTAILVKLFRRYIGRVIQTAVSHQTFLLGKPAKQEELDPREQRLLEHEQAAFSARQQARALSITKVVSSIGTIVMWVISIMIILQLFGVYIAPLLASAGIVGVAIGFGAQSLVKDFLTGLFIQFEGQYAIGDWVQADGVEGEVEHLSLRVTQLRDSEGTLHHIPNGCITQVANKTQMWSQGIIDIPVSYDTPHAVATDAIAQALARFMADEEASHDVLQDPNNLGLNAFEPAQKTYRVIVRVNAGKQWAVQRSVRQFVLEVFEELGLSMVGTSKVHMAPTPES